MIRPRDMTQQEFADLLKGEGFTACCKAAVSLAERSDVSGVQFTRAAREAAQRAVKQAKDGCEIATAPLGPRNDRVLDRFCHNDQNDKQVFMFFVCGGIFFAKSFWLLGLGVRSNADSIR